MHRDRITPKALDYLELVKGMKESEIAWHFEITRMGLFKLRKRIGHPQRCRSDFSEAKRLKMWEELWGN